MDVEPGGAENLSQQTVVQQKEVGPWESLPIHNWLFTGRQQLCDCSGYAMPKRQHFTALLSSMGASIPSVPSSTMLPER